jgi:electron transport complex protein RnfG
MNVAAQADVPALPSSGRLIATLGGIAMMSGLLVVLAFELTAPRIAHNKRVALERAVFTVLPGASVRSNFFVDVSGLVPVPPEDISGANIYAGYDGAGNFVGLAMEASARGYQDVVRLLYGYAPDRECVIGITVLQSTETPGLGDKIESDQNFLANFDCLEARLNDAGAALRNEIVTVKNGKKKDPWQIDGISGATVTSTAVGKALRESTNEMLPLIRKHGFDQIPGFPPRTAETTRRNAIPVTVPDVSRTENRQPRPEAALVSESLRNPLQQSEHRTLNIQHRTSKCPGSFSSSFDVGRWMFELRHLGKSDPSQRPT